MPLLQYFLGVGGVLLCLMFALDAYVPKALPREQAELDKSTIRITARPSDSYVIDHFAPARGNVAGGPGDAAQQALAMMPEGDAKAAAGGATMRMDSPAGAHRRRVAQRPQVRVATDAPSPATSRGWPTNNAAQSWSNRWNNNSRDWSHQGWSNGWNSNHWADNQWTISR